MKRYIHRLITYLPALLLALAGTGCADDIEPDTPAEAAPDSITLELTVPMEPATRAAKTETELNEFTVTSVHLYFYKSGDGDDTASSYDCIVNGTFTNTKKVTVPMPANALEPEGLFGSKTEGAKCKVYAVANVNDKLPEGTPKSINKLKALQIGSTFDQTIAQPSFAMDGGAEITLVDGTARRASGEIELTRAAAKLTLAIKLPESVKGTINGTTTTATYTPNVEGMHVWIGNGVKNSQLNTEPVEAADAAIYSNERKTTEGTGSKFIKDDSMADGYIYVQDIPFYSYPNKWDGISPDGNTHLTLVVPWTYEYTDANGVIQKGQLSTYYRFAVQPDQCEISRNTHYDMRVSISRLGSVDPQEPINMVFDWNYAIPWKTESLETDIKAIRYLILNQNYYKDGAYVFEMNNETSTEITLGTSHDVEIAEVTLTWTDYSQNQPQKRTITLTTEGDYKYSDIAKYEADYKSGTDEGPNKGKFNIFAGIEINNEGKQRSLKLKRNFNHIVWENNKASITPNNAFCAYTFDITLCHKDDHLRKATVRIIQYPAIYITAEETPSGTRFVNNNNTTYRKIIGYDWWDNPILGDPMGYSNYQNVPSDEIEQQYFLGSIHNESVYVGNKNTYIITISRFNEEETADYIIADPRKRSVNNLPVTGSQTDAAAWSISDNKKQLLFYYPADNNSSKTRYLAPKIRIASQWGVTCDMTREGAQRRCASYQENGRPAGRWRLPTIAEIEFIAKLSSNYYIPFLFGNDSGNNNADYWCASGAVLVHNEKDNKSYVTSDFVDDGINSVRCVYDEWYWGNDTLVEADKDKFRWGDRARTITGNAAVRKYFGH